MAADTPTSAVDASRDVLGRGSLYTLATAAPILANVAVTPFVTRLLGAAEYGVVAIAIVIITVGMMLAGLGMTVAITRHGILERSGHEGARALVFQGSGLAVAILVLATATGRWWAPGVVGVPWRPALAFALAAAAGFAVAVNAQSYLRVRDRPLPFVALAAIATLGGPVAGLALLQSTGGGADRYVAGLLIGYATAGVVGVALVRSGGRARAHRGDLRRALRLGVPAVPHQVALFLANGALVLIASQVFGTAAGGRMQLALLVGSAPAMITTAFNNAWSPVIYRTAIAQRGVALEHTARDIAAFTAVLSGGVALLAPWLMRVLAPASYAPTGLVAAVGVTSIGSVLSVAYLANLHLILAAGRSAGLALVSPLSLGAGLLSAALASMTGPLTAVALGFPVTYLALAIGTALLRRRVSPTRWAEHRMSLPLLIGVAACLLGAALPVVGASALAFRLPLVAAVGLGGMLLVVRVMRR
ncbi:MAG: oligosaccharide flippase family protein [Pseudonocardiaceae bacterium]|nr:oligosaccharide flippase family protein [Pseudonocardiaceae bacterium]